MRGTATRVSLSEARSDDGPVRPISVRLRATRRGLQWRTGLLGGRRLIEWHRILSWSVGRDTAEDAPRHTHVLRVEHIGGVVECRTRGPFGLIALIEMRTAMRLRLRRLLK